MKRFIRVGVFVLIAFVAVFLLFCVSGLIARYRLNASLSTLREKNIPLTLEDMIRLYPDIEKGAEHQPAFFLTLKQINDLPEPEATSRRYVEYNLNTTCELPKPISKETALAMENRITQTAGLLKTLGGCMELNPKWYVVPAVTPTGLNVPEVHRLNGIRRSVRLYTMAAIYHAEKNDPAEATKALLNGINLSRFPGQGGFLIDGLVNVACLSHIILSLEHILAKTEPTAEQLNRILLALPARISLRPEIGAEIIYAKSNFDSGPKMSVLEAKGIVDAYPYTGMQPPWWKSGSDRFSAFIGWHSMLEKYYIESLADIYVHWDSEWSSCTNRQAVTVNSIPWLYHIDGGVPDQMVCVKGKELAIRGMIDCARLAIAIKKYSTAKGELPESQDSLMPDYVKDIPKDPFLEKPYIYSVSGDQGCISFVNQENGKNFQFKVFKPGSYRAIEAEERSMQEQMEKRRTRRSAAKAE